MTRLEIATQLAAGLLASQNPEKGWYLGRVCEVALRTADTLIDMEAKPLPKPAEQTKQDESAGDS